MTARRHRPSKAIPALTSGPVSVSADAAGLAALVRKEIAELSQEKPTKSQATKTRRQNQIKRCADILRKLGEITGESTRMPESKVVRHPSFRRVVDEIVRALERWPEALKAVGETLDRLERGEPAERTGA